MLRKFNYNSSKESQREIDVWLVGVTCLTITSSRGSLPSEVGLHKSKQGKQFTTNRGEHVNGHTAFINRSKCFSGKNSQEQQIRSFFLTIATFLLALDVKKQSVEDWFSS